MEFRALVSYDWDSSDPAEMSVRTGQILVVQSVNERGWALALDEESGASGWVPNDYLQPYEEDEIIEEIPVQEISHHHEHQQQQHQQQQQQHHQQQEEAQIAQAMQALQVAIAEPTPQAQPQHQQQQQQQQQPQDICAGCNQGIDASALIAKGKHFHPNCFTCTACKKPLSGGFLERDGQFFCEEDYYRTQGHICAHCNEPIIGSHIVGNSKPYHIDHLLCSLCNVSIGTDILHVKDHKNICHNCYNSTFASICATCSQPIEFQIFSALDKSYHKECFVCHEGNHPMPDESFHVHEGNIYCSDHYKKLFSKPCHGCKEDISGQYLEVVGHYFHAQCWKCTTCNALLETTGCSLKNEQFYCPACVVKIPYVPTPTNASAPKPAPSAPAAAAPAAAAPKPTTSAPAAAAPKPTPAPTAPIAAPTPAPKSSNSGLLETLHKNEESTNMSIEEMRRRLLEVSEKALAQAAKAGEIEILPEKESYTLAELMVNAQLPASIDRAKKESYLSDDEFFSVFKMKKEQFYTLQKWKQQELKKGAKIF